MPERSTKNKPATAIGGDHPGKALLRAIDWQRIADQFQLTERELGVARLIFQGKTRHEIAGELTFAQGTLRVYIDRLFDKLMVTDRLGMALRIMQAHLGEGN